MPSDSEFEKQAERLRFALRAIRAVVEGDLSTRSLFVRDLAEQALAGSVVQERHDQQWHAGYDAGYDAGRAAGRAEVSHLPPGAKWLLGLDGRPGTDE